MTACSALGRTIRTRSEWRLSADQVGGAATAKALWADAAHVRQWRTLAHRTQRPAHFPEFIPRL